MEVVYTGLEHDIRGLVMSIVESADDLSVDQAHSDPRIQEMRGILLEVPRSYRDVMYGTVTCLVSYLRDRYSHVFSCGPEDLPRYLAGDRVEAFFSRMRLEFGV